MLGTPSDVVANKATPFGEVANHGVTGVGVSVFVVVPTGCTLADGGQVDGDFGGFGLAGEAEVGGDSDDGEDTNDRDNDHQFHEGETLLGLFAEFAQHGMLLAWFVVRKGNHLRDVWIFVKNNHERLSLHPISIKCASTSFL